MREAISPPSLRGNTLSSQGGTLLRMLFLGGLPQPLGEGSMPPQLQKGAQQPLEVMKPHWFLEGLTLLGVALLMCHIFRHKPRCSGN